jgi:hypothetical protein
MKYKTTLILLGIAVALLVLVLVILPRKPAEDAAGARGPQLTDVKPEDIERIVLSGGAETIDLRRDEGEDWRLASPVSAQADSYEAGRLAEDLGSLRAERVADESPADPSEYGLPGREALLHVKGRKEPLRIEFGGENPVDGTLYARLASGRRVVLLPASIKALLDKNALDYRRKDVFNFDASKVERVALRSKDASWQAVRRDGEWRLERPVSSLADGYKIDGVLNSLSGLRASEFVSEEKTEAEVKSFGLSAAGAEVTLILPASGEEVTFFLSRKGDKAYATTSASTKIVAVEPDVLTDLAKQAEELRERGVDVFNAWEADRLRLRSGGLGISLSKDEKGRWRFASGGTGEADASKVESFIRRVDGLQAAEFIDRPGSDAAYGLDKPRAEIVISVKDPEGKRRDVTVLVGEPDEAKGQTVVKNPRLGYLLRVDASFLDDIPKTAAEWKQAEGDGTGDGAES